jgi:uncharacterized alpha-E superfamily protein
MALLSRVADRIFWAARYMERAEDTARVVRAFGDVFADMPSVAMPESAAWPPLVTLTGEPLIDVAELDERTVVRMLVADRSHDWSVVRSVGNARDNLRSTREVLPREAWQVVNDLWLFSEREVDHAVERHRRIAFLARVVDDSRRLDGVLMSTMTRDAAYDLWRLGRLLERATMTTRVVGVRAAGLMRADPADALPYDEVQWMGVLRSLSALQMYQRATHGPIEGSAVVRFLVFHESFPRSVAGALVEIEKSLENLEEEGAVREALDHARSVMRAANPSVADGADLDRAMEELQVALAEIGMAIGGRFLRVGDDE